MQTKSHDGRNDTMSTKTRYERRNEMQHFGIEREAKERQEGLLGEAQGRRLALEARAAGTEPTNEEGANTMGQITNEAAGGALVKRVVFLLATVLAGVLMAGAAAMAATGTFGNSTPIQITETAAEPDPASPYPSEIDVQGLSGTISDVNLKLSGMSNNTEARDLVVLVVGPGGQDALVMANIGSYSLSDVDITLDDEAANSIPASGGIVDGAYKPTDGNPVGNFLPAPAPTPTGNTALSVFDGTSPNGTWKLFVVDQLNDGDFGVFEGISGGWSLEITTASPTPQPDTTSPRVKSTAPLPGATGISPSANVTATFSEDMMASTINGTIFKLFRKGSITKVAATVSYDATADRATLDPTNPLKRGATYRAVVTTDAKDVAGNRLDQNPTLSGLQQKRWSFTVRN